VPFADVADLTIVAVRLEGRGLALLALDRDVPGRSYARLDTFGGEPLFEVDFDVTVPASTLLGIAGEVETALEHARLRAIVASLAYAVGASERVLEMTVEYAKTRSQFGRPIGSFQAVAHRCVDMRSDVDALRYLVYQAAWSIARGRSSGGLEVAAAKAYGNEALHRIYANAHQVHGAIGFSMEHDLQLFTRRAKAVELQWGTTSLHLERVALCMGLG
jgi:alkylation response protein AidB-like acyl-CoA dehydrogenase